jgi:glycyl-tRNA synthetase (class II)
MSQLVPKVLNLAHRNGFILSSDVIAESIKFGPSGQLLRNNISHEWFYSNVVEVDNVFPIGQEYCKNQSWTGSNTFYLSQY